MYTAYIVRHAGGCELPKTGNVNVHRDMWGGLQPEQQGLVNGLASNVLIGSILGASRMGPDEVHISCIPDEMAVKTASNLRGQIAQVVPFNQFREGQFSVTYVSDEENLLGAYVRQNINGSDVVISLLAPSTIKNMNKAGEILSSKQLPYQESAGLDGILGWCSEGFDRIQERGDAGITLRELGARTGYFVKNGIDQYGSLSKHVAEIGVTHPWAVETFALLLYSMHHESGTRQATMQGMFQKLGGTLKPLDGIKIVYTSRDKIFAAYPMNRPVFALEMGLGILRNQEEWLRKDGVSKPVQKLRAEELALNS